MAAEMQTVVFGAPTDIAVWLQALSGALPPDWSRGTTIEHQVRGRRTSRWPICLIWSPAGRPKTALFLQGLTDSEIAVTSVVPVQEKRLTPTDQAAALQAFATALVAPQALQTKEMPVSAGLAEMISPQAMARFVTFARTANKTLLHSGLDLPRWHDFLIQLHRDGSRPTRADLAAALAKDSFSDSVVQQLLDDYDGTGDLLDRYDALTEKE